VCPVAVLGSPAPAGLVAGSVFTVFGALLGPLVSTRPDPLSVVVVGGGGVVVVVVGLVVVGSGVVVTGPVVPLGGAVVGDAAGGGETPAAGLSGSFASSAACWAARSALPSSVETVGSWWRAWSS